MKLSIRKSVSPESGLNKRHKDKKYHLTLCKDLLNGGAFQGNTNVLKVLHTGMKSIPGASENLTALSLNRNFSVSEEELRISRSITGSLLERKL